MKAKIVRNIVIVLSPLIFFGCSTSTAPDINDDLSRNGTNIADQAIITYSSISTSSYKGYTPSAQATVDGIIEHNNNLWSAQSFSGSGWIAYTYTTKKSISEIRIYAGSAHYGSLYYSVQYIDNSGNWVDLTEPAWVDANLRGGSEYPTSAQNVFRYVVNPSNISTKGIRVYITDSHYPSSHLWRTVVTEVEIYTK